MEDHWTYDNTKHTDKNGEQWHFVRRSFLSESVPYDERPVEIYFRNGSRTYYGFVRFEHSKDNPYKHAKLVEKVMRDKEFREKHVAMETNNVWLKNWK
ncbi:MAG: hypothetical protein OEZ39_12305 [Gammaproteobacteria bacterium]|nr:hypothetical protein [Gammaproteobacteria bacterium]MDH5652627.1 hypothetical protein [Gammaproteobacteria bacterium]